MNSPQSYKQIEHMCVITQQLKNILNTFCMLLGNGLNGGNEYHLLTLVIGLQRDIYCYVPFRLTELTPHQRNDPKELQSLFDTHKLSNHLLYRALPEMRSVNTTPKTLCAFFMMHKIITQLLNGD